MLCFKGWGQHSIPPKAGACTIDLKVLKAKLRKKPKQPQNPEYPNKPKNPSQKTPTNPNKRKKPSQKNPTNPKHPNQPKKPLFSNLCQEGNQVPVASEVSLICKNLNRSKQISNLWTGWGEQYLFKCKPKSINGGKPSVSHYCHMYTKVTVWRTIAKFLSILWEHLKEVTVNGVNVTSLWRASGRLLEQYQEFVENSFVYRKWSWKSRARKRLESPIVCYGISSYIPYDQLRDWLKTTSFVKVNCSSNPE